MKQPALGKKIQELRLAKGLTQGELAEMCKLSLRTIQRIESAEVNPRSYTIKQIFSVLEFRYYDSVRLFPGLLSHQAGRKKATSGVFLRLLKDLFNLKTNTMKKVTILSLASFALIFAVSSIVSNTSAQSNSKVKKFIEKSNENFIECFNSGNIDKLMRTYSDDACIIARGCGKSFIKEHYTRESKFYSFVSLDISSVSVSDSIAVEKGDFKIQLFSGGYIEGEYISEWHLFDKGWLVVSESSSVNPGK